MGAPKQKWTAAEEAALRAGIAKYGLGKWSTILKDPEFSAVLHSRSNVDLKDKWRNINVMVNGSGSRQRGRCARPAIENNVENDDIKPLDQIPPVPLLTAPKRPLSRLENVILEAINELKEPRGSSLAAIALYIEERYSAPSNFGELLEGNLKHLTEFGRLVKVNHQYKLAASSTSFDILENPIQLLLGEKKDSLKVEGSMDRTLTKDHVDSELEIMKNMTVREAAAAAAMAIAEAERAMAEAEKAAREAEEAEAEAEAAKCCAEAAIRAFKPQTQRAWKFVVAGLEKFVDEKQKQVDSNMKKQYLQLCFDSAREDSSIYLA